jgi:hypothetical protein
LTIEKKLAALQRIYGIYEEIVADATVACQPGCTHCCTTKVLLTTLEACRLLQITEKSDNRALLRSIRAVDVADRFRAGMTTNQLAAACAAGEDPPLDAGDDRYPPCPLLADSLCSIYPLRPFNCRCFVSRSFCGETGLADVDDYIVSVNTVFLQTIEHLDRPGCCGSLPDIVTALENGARRRAYLSGKPICEAAGLLPNRPITALMVPPQHRGRMGPVLRKLQSIRL